MHKKLAIRVLLPAVSALAVLSLAFLAPTPARWLGPFSLVCYGYGYGCPAPTVTNVSPNNGPVSGGTTVTITGTDFNNNLSAVNFGATPAASFTFVSDTQITAVSPAEPQGTVDITVTTAGGTSATTPADQFTFTNIVQYFNWYDTATPGMVADNIHLLNTSASTAHITVALSGATTINVTLAAGAEQYVSFGKGHLGGPVIVTADQNILASQRVQYYQSFNEIWGEHTSQAAMKLYIPWFDTATPGMVADNIHVLNPGNTTANVTVTLDALAPIVFNLAAGAEQYVSFGKGHLGGPVVITATQPVLAAQRIQYYQSFNEEIARSSADANIHSAFHWFDRATPGMVGDNIHVVNTSLSTATGTVTLAGAPTQNFSLAPGAETYVTFGSGHIGGPVVITSDQPVLASQRVQYFQSFNEVPASTQAQASLTSHIMWFDKATPGMVGDNIHVLNASGSTATGTISMPGATTINFSLAPGQEAYFTFAGHPLGGPVTITADQVVLAAQRVQYFQSFNEVASM